MGRNVKLNSKIPTQKKEEKESFFFFVPHQGEGAARVVVIILKVLELIMTTIFGVVLGIFGPLVIRGLDIQGVSSDPSSIYWIVRWALYIIGLFILMLGHSRIATAVHIIAAVGTFITHFAYLKIFRDQQENGLMGLYMPCLFITVMTIVIMLLINLPKWIDKRVRKANEQAPSILDDSDE